jgi:hypothetical protein
MLPAGFGCLHPLMRNPTPSFSSPRSRPKTPCSPPSLRMQEKLPSRHLNDNPERRQNIHPPTPVPAVSLMVIVYPWAEPTLAPEVKPNPARFGPLVARSAKVLCVPCHSSPNPLLSPAPANPVCAPDTCFEIPRAITMPWLVGSMCLSDILARVVPAGMSKKIVARYSDSRWLKILIRSGACQRKAPPLGGRRVLLSPYLHRSPDNLPLKSREMVPTCGPT